MNKDDDNPELSDADFARAKPFREAFPELYRSWQRRGRPPLEKKPLTPTRPST